MLFLPRVVNLWARDFVIEGGGGEGFVLNPVDKNKMNASIAYTTESFLMAC